MNSQREWYQQRIKVVGTVQTNREMFEKIKDKYPIHQKMPRYKYTGLSPAHFGKEHPKMSFACTPFVPDTESCTWAFENIADYNTFLNWAMKNKKDVS